MKSGEKEFQCMLIIVFIDKQYVVIFSLLVLRYKDWQLLSSVYLYTHCTILSKLDLFCDFFLQHIPSISSLSSIFEQFLNVKCSTFKKAPPLPHAGFINFM